MKKENVILEFKGTSENVAKRMILNNNNRYSSTDRHGVTLESMLRVGSSVKNGDFIISKIRRGSDGVEFSIGDSIHTGDGEAGKITEFLYKHPDWSEDIAVKYEGENFNGTGLLSIFEHVDKKDIEISSLRRRINHLCQRLKSKQRPCILFFDDINTSPPAVSFRDIEDFKPLPFFQEVINEKMKELKKDHDNLMRIVWSIPRKPILTTHDGVEIFEGDDRPVYWMNKNDFRIFRAEKPEIIKWNDGDIIFSTEEAAARYVEDNKPVFSLMEVMAAMTKAKVAAEEEKGKIDIGYVQYLLQKAKERIRNAKV